MVLLFALACSTAADPTAPTPAPATPAPAAAAPAAEEPPAPSPTGDRGPWVTPPPSVVPAAERIIAFADVHGDLDATRAALRLGGLIDAEDRWVGGATVAVQTGDQLDRGDGERAILDLFERLSEEAWAAGGAFYPLLGNHETMNVALDLRYVTPGGFADFADLSLPGGHPLAGQVRPEAQGRVAAFSPGGPYANRLAGHNAVMQVGDTVFTHGGVLPIHAEHGLDVINRSIQAWMVGQAPAPEVWIGSEGPLWTRLYSDGAPSPEACATLDETLEKLGASRMVVGHTVQPAPSAACDGKVWRMDVGMAAHYGGTPAVLEIQGDTVRVLR